MNILEELRRRFASALVDFTEDPRSFASLVRPAQDRRFGDFQANCAMPLAKQNGTDPRALAVRLVEKLNLVDLCEPPEIAGPGFINLRLRDDWLAGQLNAMAQDERLGVETAETPKKIVLDYSSPNVAKPMHVGHLRSTVIGDALYRVLSYLGHDVVSDNHIGDWGTQFGMIIFGYKNLRDDDAFAADPVGELARLYRLVNQLGDYHEAKQKKPTVEQRLTELEARLNELTEQEAGGKDPKRKKELKKLRSDIGACKEDVASLRRKIETVEQDPKLVEQAETYPNIAREARDETARLHAGDEENRKLWNEFLPLCLDALERVYKRLGIHFDMALGESYYDEMLPGVVDELKQTSLAQESEGAQCVFLPGHDAPFIVQKQDGAYTYATTDLATIRYRVQQLHADTILYVVDARQGEHFDLLFETARKWGYGETDFRHVSFGTVMGKDRKPYKTRSGDTVGLESLLDEAVAKARQIVSDNDEAKPDGPELDDNARDRIAEVVGLGGIKYADLRHNRESDYVFDWDKMLAMTGETATYMQYAYARVQGILRRGGVDVAELRASQDPIQLREPAERGLGLALCRFAEAVELVATDYRPNVLTQYLFDLANEFSTFFEQCPVLKAEDEQTRHSRLRIVDLTGQVIERGLALLGIATCDRM